MWFFFFSNWDHGAVFDELCVEKSCTLSNGMNRLTEFSVVCILLDSQLQIALCPRICMAFQECNLNAGLLLMHSPVPQEIFTWGQSHNSTSCFGRKVTKKNTQKEPNREKKTVCSAHCVFLDKQCACILPSRYKGLCIVSHLCLTK